VKFIFPSIILCLTSCAFFVSHPKLDEDLIDDAEEIVEDIIKDG
jgi:hypothetical protein